MSQFKITLYFRSISQLGHMWPLKGRLCLTAVQSLASGWADCSHSRGCLLSRLPPQLSNTPTFQSPSAFSSHLDLSVSVNLCLFVSVSLTCQQPYRTQSSDFLMAWPLNFGCLFSQNRILGITDGELRSHSISTDNLSVSVYSQTPRRQHLRR